MYITSTQTTLNFQKNRKNYAPNRETHFRLPLELVGSHSHLFHDPGKIPLVDATVARDHALTTLVYIDPACWRDGEGGGIHVHITYIYIYIYIYIHCSCCVLLIIVGVDPGRCSKHKSFIQRGPPLTPCPPYPLTFTLEALSVEPIEQRAAVAAECEPLVVVNFESVGHIDAEPTSLCHFLEGERR